MTLSLECSQSFSWIYTQNNKTGLLRSNESTLGEDISFKSEKCLKPYIHQLCYVQFIPAILFLCAALFLNIFCLLALFIRRLTVVSVLNPLV